MNNEIAPCAVCGKDCEILMCCNGWECGCMGMPVAPPVCSAECEEEYMMGSHDIPFPTDLDNFFDPENDEIINDDEIFGNL